MNIFRTSSHHDADDAPVTQALPAPVFLGSPDEEDPAPFDAPEISLPDDEPFIPKKRYKPARSTKVLVCVLLVVSGFFGGSVLQKQIDLGNRTARTNSSNFQGTNARTGAGAGNDGAGTQTPGQGRRNGNTNTAAPTAGQVP